MAAKKLRAVAAGETVTPRSVADAAERGTTRDLLMALRWRIAQAVQSPTTPPRDLAALTKRLVEIVRDIEAIDSRSDEEEEVVKDEPFDASVV